jgi:hypothetical protein
VRAIHFEELGKEKTAWIYPEMDGSYEFAEGEPDPARGVAVKIRYVSQKESELLGRKLQAKGILKQRNKHGHERIDWTPGREQERNLMFAESMVIDLRGINVPYTPEVMAQAFADVRGLFDAVSNASREFDAFFVGNGNGSSGNSKP